MAISFIGGQPQKTIDLSQVTDTIDRLEVEIIKKYNISQALYFYPKLDRGRRGGYHVVVAFTLHMQSVSMTTDVSSNPIQVRCTRYTIM